MLKLENIKKSFNLGKKDNYVLKDTSLHVVKGEMIAIMGRSGSGKSTLLNIISGLDKPTDGKYIFGNEDITVLDYKKLATFRRDHIGFIAQNFALIEEKNVFDNISLPLWYSKTPKETITQKVNQVLKDMNLNGKSLQYPSELSGGESQRVAIARALINDPEIILADEPTGSLDEKTEQIILNIFKRLNQQGKTIIIVTHDQSVAAICDRVFHLSNGKLS